MMSKSIQHYLTLHNKFLSAINTSKHLIYPLFEKKVLDAPKAVIDLSETNQILKNASSQKNFLTALNQYIEDCLQKQCTPYSIGRYLEKRIIYRFEQYNPELNNPRNIHLGLDIGAPSGTALFCPLDAYVHSIKNNEQVGDYGPTVILRHQLDDLIFYTLYGHLSKESLISLNEGEQINTGKVFASIGCEAENGGWRAHLHFQIILDLQDYQGTYPGVCNEETLNFYKLNCPDPGLMLPYKLF